MSVSVPKSTDLKDKGDQEVEETVKKVSFSELRAMAFGRSTSYQSLSSGAALSLLPSMRPGYGVGSRKRAKAFVSVVPSLQKSPRVRISVNGRPCEKYFPSGLEAAEKARRPLELLSLEKSFAIQAKVRGGGTTG